MHKELQVTIANSCLHENQSHHNCFVPMVSAIVDTLIRVNALASPAMNVMYVQVQLTSVVPFCTVS